MKLKGLFLILSSVILSSCTLFPSASTNQNINLNTSPTSNMAQTTSSPNPTVNQVKDTITAITTKNGQIVLKLYSDVTPHTVANFLKKVNSGFYDGLTFHRVIPDFMAQGGDPTGTGSGGGSQTSELNNLPFKRGSLGLARTPASKEISNDSQFFICFTTDGCQHLTGDYVNFGEVISGFDVLDKIVMGDKIIKITTTTK